MLSPPSSVRPPPMHKICSALLLAAAIGFVLAVAWHDRGMAVDDAYITFRYAQNVLSGHGLVWNPGSVPCEGYTNLTYVIGIAGLGALGVAPTHAAWGLAALSLLGLGFLFWRATCNAGRLAPLAIAPAMLVLLNADLAVHASRGLETVAFAFFAVGQVVAVARICGPGATGTRDGLIAAGFGCLLYLTRPDGVLLTASCGLVALWLVWREPPRRRVLLLAALLWLLSGLVYASWKLWYFGHLLPNAFYMKAGGASFAGLRETTAFLTDYAPLWLSGLIVAILSIWQRRRAVVRGTGGVQRDISSVLAIAVAVPWLAYSAKIVHEIGFAHRFVWPLAAVLAIGCASGITSLVASLPVRAQRGWLLAWAALGLAVFANFSSLGQQWAKLREPPAVDPYTSMFLRLGDAIRETGIGPQLVLYCSHAGATPYAAGVHHVDPAGLVDDGYCGRTPAEQRARYQAGLQLDVVAWHLFPASPGARSFDEDPRARTSTYLNRWVLGDDPDMDAGVRHAAAKEDLAQRKAAVFAYMVLLRDHATLVGEMNNGVKRWRSFVYVWNQSRYREQLLQSLAPRMDVPAAAVDCDQWPR
jgi:arabinofuranosyltransferase